METKSKIKNTKILQNKEVDDTTIFSNDDHIYIECNTQFKNELVNIHHDLLCDSYDGECIDVPDFYLCYLGYMPCGAKFPKATGKCPMLGL